MYTVVPRNGASQPAFAFKLNAPYNSGTIEICGDSEQAGTDKRGNGIRLLVGQHAINGQGMQQNRNKRGGSAYKSTPGLLIRSVIRLRLDIADAAAIRDVTRVDRSAIGHSPCE